MSKKALLNLLLVDVYIFVYLAASLRKLINFAKREGTRFFGHEGADWRRLRNVLIALLAVLVFSTALDVLALDRENMRYTPLPSNLINSKFKPIISKNFSSPGE